MPVRIRTLNPITAQLHLYFKKRRKEREKLFCLLEASGRVRARTEMDWEQVVQWKRGQRTDGGRRRGALQTALNFN